MSAEETETILVFAANPEDQPRLALDREVREIDNALRHARKHFDVRPKLATRPEDLRRALLDHTATHVHFCGHGAGAPGIMFEGQLVAAEPLADLFKLFSAHIRCVVLNACYSKVQAEAIAQHIDYVVGMSSAIGDEAAILFSTAFYDAIGAGKGVPFAFALGCNAIQVAGLPDHLIPQLLTRTATGTGEASKPQTQVLATRRDWDGAPVVSLLYGRESAAELLRSWILDDSCRVVLITGMGGVGKTDLVTCLGRGGNRSEGTSSTLAAGIEGHFDVVLWRSLLNAPPPEHLFSDILGVLSSHEDASHASVDDQLNDILSRLQSQRCLIILDNVEAVLRPGDPTVSYRDGYEQYGDFLAMVGRANHQSCVLLTSREKPRSVADLEGARKPVRSLALTGIGALESQQIFAQIGSFRGSNNEWKEIASRYAGNPLALELVARHVEQVYDGDLSAFLAGGRSLFNDIEQLLDWHLRRLSQRETELILWLAIEREPVTRETLENDLMSAASRDRLTSTLQNLQRRIPLERLVSHHFTLQPVLIEFITATFVERITDALAPSIDEILTRTAGVHVSALLQTLNTHSLVKATARENVREAQQRLILAPIAEQIAQSCDARRLYDVFGGFIERWRSENAGETGYAVGNLINLLAYMDLDMHGMDFSGLRVRQASLHDVTLHETDFSFAEFRDTTFRHAFGAAFAIAYTPDGRFVAIGDDNGEVRLFSVATGQLHMRCAGHADVVSSVVFSKDGELMASASYDNTIRLWNTTDGHCVNVLLGHEGWVYSTAFSPDGKMLASASEDGTCRTWNLETGRSQELPMLDVGFVASVAFSHDGRFLAAAGSTGVVHLYSVPAWDTPGHLYGHDSRIRSLAFSAQGDILASGADDGLILLWNPDEAKCVASLSGHEGAVMSLSFTAAGDILASGSNDQTVRLWSTVRNQCVAKLRASPSRVWSVACSPTRRTVAVASEDSTARIWDIDSRQRIAAWRGYSNKSWALSFGADDNSLAVGNEDSIVRIWDTREARLSRELRGHTSRIWAVACSADGAWLASGSDDLTMRLWDLRTGTLRHVVRGHDDWIRALSFSPDSRLVASGAEDGQVLICDTLTGGVRRMIGSGLPRVFAVAFCGGGRYVAVGGAGEDIRLFSVVDGVFAGSLRGHQGWLSSLRSLNTSTLASGSEDGTVRIWNLDKRECSGEIFVNQKVWCIAATNKWKSILAGVEDGTLRCWDLEGGSRDTEVRAHQGSLWSLAVNPSEDTVATAGDDGLIRLWRLPDLAPFASPNALRSPRPYEGMNITGVMGLTTEQRNALTALGAIELPSR